jgi:hypothetical protein
MLFLSRFVVNCEKSARSLTFVEVTYIISDADLQLARHGQQARHGGDEVSKWHQRLLIWRTVV